MRWKGSYKYLAIVDCVAGILLIIGLYTQGALLLTLLLIIKEWYINSRIAPLTTDQKMILVFIFVISLALMCLGPGSFALDYPL
jgi:uncharacterized membrane protein YphA (DoxX/SURF4 family)